MNTENSKTNESNIFIYQFTDKLNLKTPNNKNIGLVDLSIYYTWKNIKSEYTTINLTYLPQLGIILLICLMVLTQFLTFRITLNLSSKNTKLKNKIKIKNRTVFKEKTSYKLELLSRETMKLIGSTKKDVDKDKDEEVVSKLESVEVVLVHCNLVNTSYQQASKVLFTSVPNKQFGQLITISPHSLMVLKTTNTKISIC